MALRDTSLFAQLLALTPPRCFRGLSFDVFLDTLAASVRLEELTPVLRRPSISLLRLRKLALRGHRIVPTSAPSIIRRPFDHRGLWNREFRRRCRADDQRNAFAHPLRHASHPRYGHRGRHGGLRRQGRDGV